MNPNSTEGENDTSFYEKDITTIVRADYIFVVTPTSLLLSWIGHLVFGYTLGCLVNRFGTEGICVWRRSSGPSAWP